MHACMQNLPSGRSSFLHSVPLPADKMGVLYLSLQAGQRLSLPKTAMAQEDTRVHLYPPELQTAGFLNGSVQHLRSLSYTLHEARAALHSSSYGHQTDFCDLNLSIPLSKRPFSRS